MPQVQIIPRQPSPLEQLAPYIQNFTENIGHGLAKRAENKQNAAAQQRFREAKTPEEMAEASFGFSPEVQKNLSPIFGALIKNAAEKQSAQQQGLSDQDYSNILDDLENDVESGNVGLLANIKSYLPGQLGSTEREATAAFQSKSTALLGLAQKIALKQGIRNQREFDTFLKRTIPNEGDTTETQKGKIRALRSYLHGEKIPESAYKESNEENVQEFQKGQTFESLPDPEKVQIPVNAVVTNGQQRFRFNGKRWEKIK